MGGGKGGGKGETGRELRHATHNMIAACIETPAPKKRGDIAIS